MGGFPDIFDLIRHFAQATLPGVYQRMESWLHPTPKHKGKEDGPPMRWLHKGLELEGLSIGRNSDFHTDELSDDQLEALGGIEYRALSALSYIVICVSVSSIPRLLLLNSIQYFVGVQLVSFILIAPWLQTTTQYDEVFQNQFKLVPKSW